MKTGHSGLEGAGEPRPALVLAIAQKKGRCLNQSERTCFFCSEFNAAGRRFSAVAAREFADDGADKISGVAE